LPWDESERRISTVYLLSRDFDIDTLLT
jgi:hypothetical protein